MQWDICFGNAHGDKRVFVLPLCRDELRPFLSQNPYSRRYERSAITKKLTYFAFRAIIKVKRFYIYCGTDAARRSVVNITRKLCKNCFSPKAKRNEKCRVCGYAGGSGDMSLLPRGTRLCGRYIIGGAIGRGGFGVTYLAYDTTDRKTVAVKEYFPSMLAMRSRERYVIPNNEKSAEQFNIGAEKFFDEAKLVRQFNGNPNIVSIYECFYENNTAYYIMEYLDGITLEKYAEKYGALNSEQAAYIADKLTMALIVLHSGKVLHRDISPDNVMLCKDGRVKLIDFGAARQFLSDGTLGYTVIMKTGFSPMEQYSQDTNTDIRTDIYSTGTLLYYALTGKIPESPYRRLENNSAFKENIGGGLRLVIEKAAAIMPAERYQSVEEFRAGLASLDIKMTAIAVPKDHNSLNNERFASSGSQKKRIKARLFAVIAASVCVLAAAVFIISSVRGRSSLSENKKIVLKLDNEYAGHFNIGGKIPASTLKKVGGDVEITLHVRPWEDMEPNNICGVIPVNSENENVLRYLSAPNELWADANGWITVEKDAETLSLVISEKGVESLGDGELGFEMYDLIITSAELKRAGRQQEILIDDWYELRNATYHISGEGNGKTATVPLDEEKIQDWPNYATQTIPKAAFYEIDGDVKVTVLIEPIEGLETELRIVYAQNAGYCFNVLDNYFLVPVIRDSAGKALVKYYHSYGMMLEKSVTELTFIIPENAKEKMSAGVFFQSMGVKVTQARLETYDGEYNEFY